MKIKAAVSCSDREQIFMMATIEDATLNVGLYVMRSESRVMRSPEDLDSDRFPFPKWKVPKILSTPLLEMVCEWR